MLGRRLRSLGFDVVQDGVADILGKRQQCFATRFADYAEPATLPVDVSDAELAQVPVAKTETSEQEQHGAVAGAIRSRSDDPLNILRGQVARQRRQAPMGDGRDGGNGRRGSGRLPRETGRSPAASLLVFFGVGIGVESPGMRALDP
jgi:hypothetical protein